jgi:hypothetical protein
MLRVISSAPLFAGSFWNPSFSIAKRLGEFWRSAKKAFKLA